MRLARKVLRRVWTHPGNRGRRLRALGRAFGWQLYKRLSKRPLEVRFADGFSVLCFTDSGSASNIFYGNQYFDLEEMTLIRRVLREGDGFIDGGANIGVYSLLAASLVGPTGQVVAFEPFPVHAERFRANVALNRFANVTLRTAALSEAEGTVSFVTNRDVSNRIQTRTDADADTIEVECTTLDSALAGRPRFTIGKLDLEGSEIAALRGAGRLLAEADPPLWIIEWDPGLLAKRGHDPQELLDLLAASAYRIVRVEKDRFVPATLPKVSGNIVAVHEDRAGAIEARLRERPTVPPARWRLPAPVKAGLPAEGRRL